MIRILAAVLPAAFILTQPVAAQDVGQSKVQPVEPRATVIAPAPVRAGPALGFTLRAGAATRREYFGSGSSEAAADLGFTLNYLRVGRVELGNPDPLYVPEGLGVIGSLRFIGERDDGESPELSGLEDVDASVELGAGLRYASRNFRVFGVARYGVIGHEAWVAEIGSDVLVRPTDRLTLRAGPRMLYGSDDFNDEYFGVSADEQAASGGDFAEYDPNSGLVSAGVEIGAGYRLGGDWGIDAAIRYDNLIEEAGSSPITEDDDQISARIGVTRRFTFGF